MKKRRKFSINDLEGVDHGFETWGGHKVGLHDVDDSDDLVDPDAYYMALGNYSDSIQNDFGDHDDFDNYDDFDDY